MGRLKLKAGGVRDGAGRPSLGDDARSVTRTVKLTPAEAAAQDAFTKAQGIKSWPDMVRSAVQRSMMAITNDGQTITKTSYWSTPPAARGFLYLSINAGALRMLVPSATRGLLTDLPPVGTRCDLTAATLEGQPSYMLMWHDDPEQPYAVQISQLQCDRRLSPADYGRELPLIWYLPGDGDSVREVRREQTRYYE